MSVQSIAISSLRDRLLVVGHGGLCLWNITDSGFVLDDKMSFKLGESNNPFRAAFSPDGKSVLVFSPTWGDDLPTGLFVYDLHSRVKVPIVDE